MDSTTSSLENLAAGVQQSNPAEPSLELGVDKFLELELSMSVVMGRTVMPIEQVLKLTAGSVVELDTKTTDRVEVLVEGKLVARGEVVSVNGNYGVRITEVVPAQQRFSR